MKMTSHAIKAAVAAYFRYKRQYSMVAFEQRVFADEMADVVILDTFVLSNTIAALTDRRAHFIMVEVKTSIADFRRDAAKRCHQHFRADTGVLPVIHFYFAVPKDLANKISELCCVLYPYAGVLGCSGSTGSDVEVHRHPRKLTCSPLKDDQVTDMTRAQSATLCRLAMKVAEQHQELKRAAARIKEYSDKERLEQS